MEMSFRNNVYCKCAVIWIHKCNNSNRRTHTVAQTQIKVFLYHIYYIYIEYLGMSSWNKPLDCEVDIFLI